MVCSEGVRIKSSVDDAPFQLRRLFAEVQIFEADASSVWYNCGLVPKLCIELLRDWALRWWGVGAEPPGSPARLFGTILSSPLGGEHLRADQKTARPSPSPLGQTGSGWVSCTLSRELY